MACNAECAVLGMSMMRVDLPHRCGSSDGRLPWEVYLFWLCGEMCL